MPPLPVELFIQIINCLDPCEDKRTLAASSLVSKTWLDIAHPVFFQHVSIRLNPQAKPLSPRLPLIQRHVHRVRTLSFESGWIGSGIRRPTIRLVTLLKITTWFPNLKELEISGAYIEPKCSMPSGVRRPQPSVKTIVLDSVLFISSPIHPKPPMFAYFFALWPATERILCRTAVEQDPVVLDSPEIQVASPLRTLSCSSMYDGYFPQFVENIQPFIKSLEILDYVGGYWTSFSLLLKESKGHLESLKTLRIGVDSKDILGKCAWTLDCLEEYWSNLDLRAFAALCNVNLVIKKDGFLTHTYILPTLPDSVRTLTFELDWEPEDNSELYLMGLDPSHLDGCVSRGLEKVMFMPHYLGQELTPTAEKDIRAHLVGLDSKGILHVARYCERVEGCHYGKRKKVKHIVNSSLLG